LFLKYADIYMLFFFQQPIYLQFGATNFYTKGQMMKKINLERLTKARAANNIVFKIETKESARLKLMMQVEKLDIDICKLYEEMYLIHAELYKMSNPQDNNDDDDDDDGYCENAADVVD